MSKKSSAKSKPVPYEEAVGDAPRLTLLYLGTRGLDDFRTTADIRSRSAGVAEYIRVVQPGVAPEHLGEFLSTVAHVYQALAVRLRKIEDIDAAVAAGLAVDRSLRRGDVSRRTRE